MNSKAIIIIQNWSIKEHMTKKECTDGNVDRINYYTGIIGLVILYQISKCLDTKGLRLSQR